MKELNPTIKMIKDYMKAKGITQVELSKITKLPIGSINQIFSGQTQNPRIDTLNKIKKAVYGENFDADYNFPVSSEYMLDELEKQGFVEKNEFDNLSDKQKRLIVEIARNVIKHSE